MRKTHGGLNVFVVAVIAATVSAASFAATKQEQADWPSSKPNHKVMFCGDDGREDGVPPDYSEALAKALREGSERGETVQQTLARIKAKNCA